MGEMENVVRLMLSIENKRNQNVKVPSIAGGGNSANTNVDSNIEKGVVSSITSNGMLIVVVGGNPRLMSPTTDEEFKPGQQVWTAKTVTGEWVVVGSSRK